MTPDYTRYQKKVINNYYEHRDTIVTQKLSEMVSDLYLCESPTKAEQLWKRLQTTLLSAGVPADRITHICSQRNIELLAGLVKELDSKGVAPKAVKPASPISTPTERAGASTPPTSPIAQPLGAASSGGATMGATTGATSGATAVPSPAQSPGIDEEQLKRAMTAFKKKIKSTKLDDVSGLGGRYTTRGRESSINAVTAPREFPPAIWQELVKRGRLKSVGQGMYQMP